MIKGKKGEFSQSVTAAMKGVKKLASQSRVSKNAFGFQKSNSAEQFGRSEIGLTPLMYGFVTVKKRWSILGHRKLAVQQCWLLQHMYLGLCIVARRSICCRLMLLQVVDMVEGYCYCHGCSSGRWRSS
ncbi:uncharacterized protein LOC127085481 [Lathyrus oleraceus]|uniref:uncharacterized protein LOC127085481 n=1 Tax=Pisum sativum TaxID=3888 RepID=UPI0021CF592D|nr:uncharacterized protein LOC127085481 [Pisum sativum]